MSDYIIKSGENLSRIAKAHGTTVGEIMKNNPQIKDANSILQEILLIYLRKLLLKKILMFLV